MVDRAYASKILLMLEDLKISKYDYVILGTAALTIRGVVKDAGDINIAVTKRGFADLEKNFKMYQRPNGWYVINEQIQCKIDENVKKELYHGYYLQDIYDYLKDLERSKRETDYKRIPLVRNYIERYYEL